MTKQLPSFKSHRFRVKILLALVIFVAGTHVIVSGAAANAWDLWVAHPVSVATWSALNKYSYMLDDRINACFSEIPSVPDFWGAAAGNNESTTACALGPEPANGISDRTKRSTLVQYAYAPNAHPLSPRCQAYVAELRDPGKKTVGNLFGVHALHKIERPDPNATMWQLFNLPKVELLRDEKLPPPPRVEKRSVLVNLFDALSRPLFARLIAPKLRAELAKHPSNQYTAFDFTRFHVIGYNSRRNYAALYTGHVPEIFEGMRTGRPLPARGDRDVCGVELNALVDPRADPALQGATRAVLARLCSRSLWGRYREHGYLTADMGAGRVPTESVPEPPHELGMYAGECSEGCQMLNGNGLLTVARPYADGRRVGARITLPAVAGAFHSLATKERPLFATMQSEDAHNSQQQVHSLAEEIGSFVRAVAESATARGVLLPLIVLHADHGSHYGDNTATAAGRAEHKFPTLVLLVPNVMLNSNPKLRRMLEINRRRLISAFDLHHTLLRFASSGEEETTRSPRSFDVRQRFVFDDYRDIITRRDFFHEEISIDRPCADAGIEPYLCQCDSWTPCPTKDAPAVAQQATFALAMLNGRLKAMRAIAVKKGIDVSACAPSLELVSATGARTSDVPPAVEFAMAVRTGRREARFFVSMLCEASKRPQLRRDSAAAGSGTGENTMRLQSRRFVPPLHEPCALSNLIRLSAMTRAEDAVYTGMETHSGDGKLCLIPHLEAAGLP